MQEKFAGLETELETELRETRKEVNMVLQAQAPLSFASVVARSCRM